MTIIDTLRTYSAHEPGYRAAQQHGFATIRRIEEALHDRDGWAGRYTAWFNPVTEDYEDFEDCSAQYDEAHRVAADLAADAALGNARGIVIAQQRSDEVARLILAAGSPPG